VNRSTSKPYVKTIGNSATEVTGSCHLVRYLKYALLLDCGLVQGHDIATDYKLNSELVKKVKADTIDYIILTHLNSDHCCLTPALYAQGCHAHLYVPKGSTPFLQLMWKDTAKIMEQDCEKMNRKGAHTKPLYTELDIKTALNRIVECDIHTEIQIAPEIKFVYYPANHIIHACQIYLTIQDGYVLHRLGYTGDIGGNKFDYFTDKRESLPYVNVLLGESTYCSPKRPNKYYDREKDEKKIEAVIRDSRKVLIPCFSLHRTQIMLTTLYTMWKAKKLPKDVKIYLDSPLAQRICDIWPVNTLWDNVKTWENFEYIKLWTDSITKRVQDELCVVLAASGFLQNGRVVPWLENILPDGRNTILFCGYSGENNIASQIRSGDKFININGKVVKNRANIVELVSFSSHASYEELIEYYVHECRFDKIVLVHGNQDDKVKFAHTLQDAIYDNANTAKVVAANKDTKIIF